MNCSGLVSGPVSTAHETNGPAPVPLSVATTDICVESPRQRVVKVADGTTVGASKKSRTADSDADTGLPEKSAVAVHRYVPASAAPSVESSVSLLVAGFTDTSVSMDTAPLRSPSASGTKPLPSSNSQTMAGLVNPVKSTIASKPAGCVSQTVKSEGESRKTGVWARADRSAPVHNRTATTAARGWPVMRTPNIMVSSLSFPLPPLLLSSRRWQILHAEWASTRPRRRASPPKQPFPRRRSSASVRPIRPW